MKDKPIIEARNIGKRYDINHFRGGYTALRDVLANVARAPFSFLKSKMRTAIGLEKKEEFWALKDVSFNINKGEVVGIIGANGAGKSTLLKILSQITPPTEGQIILRGKVGSLLEVGTGFHPELTGRENIFLNGAILGMKKKEIEEKFNEITAFAGIEKFLDTPVKRYSSGMYVRLAFSVAAHMEPDILLVDEVLAVGDTEFQKKCLAKMSYITKEEGRTILFVSHNMAAMRQLCKKCMILNRGKIERIGETSAIIDEYMLSSAQSSNLKSRVRQGEQSVIVTTIGVADEHGRLKQELVAGENFNLLIEIESKKESENLTLDIAFYGTNDICMGASSTENQIQGKHLGSEKFLIRFPALVLSAGFYRVAISLSGKTDGVSLVQDYIGDAISLHIEQNSEIPSWIKESILLKCEVKNLG